jgi:sigma-E factor negative regulatory protein RseA
MVSQLSETLSAVVDDEASSFETRRLVDELGRDPTLRERWHRYHLIGAALRREVNTVDHGRALARFWQAVDGGERPLVPSAAIPESVLTRRRRRGRTTSVVVAASVALAIVVGFYPRQEAPDDLSPALTGLERTEWAPFAYRGQPAVPVATPAEARLVRVLPSESDLARMQAYMLHHAHHAALTRRTPGTVPFVKVAAFESR